MAETYKINDVEYDCEFKFKNSDGQEMEYTNSAIRGLTISDSIFNPFIEDLLVLLILMIYLRINFY